MSGSCRVFPSRDSSLRELRGSPSKRVTHSWFALLTLLLSFVVFNSVSALTYQNDTNVDFTINPTISVSLSGDLLISDLVPGSYADSNIITVNAATNASHGYYLAATVGDSNSSSSNHNTNLTHSTNSNYTFTKLSSNAANLSDFSDNQWGYSYSTDNGTNWVSGSQGSTNTGYNGLPLDGNDNGATGITLIDTTSPVANNSVKFKIGAKASNTQPAGTYTNTINFYVVTHQAPLTFDDAFAAAGKTKYLNYYKMQDMTSGICANAEQGFTTKLIDIRDNQTYLVGKAKDDNCWMLQNLKLGKNTNTLTLDNATSNVDSNGFTLDGKLLNGFFTFETVDGEELQNNNSQYYCTDDYGCYYNWHTATAGVGTTWVSNGSMSYDICPTNWSLPTGGSDGQLASLYNKYPSATLMLVEEPTTSTENTTAKIPGFLLSGYHRGDGGVYVGTKGVYWSRTARSSYGAYDIVINTDAVSLTDYSAKYNGFAVRCLAK